MSHFYQFFLAVASLFLWATLPAQTLAFDCNKAVSQTEKAICSSPSLVALDKRMARYYIKALGGLSSKNRRTLRKSQHNWLKSRNSCKKDISCLKGFYRNWISQYHKFSSKLASKNRPAAKTKKAPGKARTAQVPAKKSQRLQRTSSPSPALEIAKPIVLHDNY